MKKRTVLEFIIAIVAIPLILEKIVRRLRNATSRINTAFFVTKLK